MSPPRISTSELQHDHMARIPDEPIELEDVELIAHGQSDELDDDDDDGSSSDSTILVATTRRLYISHFLSTWNSRSFEFGAVLFLAAIYTGTLLPLSVYALVRSTSAILFAPVVGQAIDTINRLSVVRFSIIAQRASVALSCLCFLVILVETTISSRIRDGIFCLVVLLACIEKNASVMNTVAIERDWAVTIAGKNESSLRSLNATMRRIDLICKLCGPLVIGLIDAASTKAAIWTTLGLNVASVVTEYYAIAQVYINTPSLHELKTSSSEQASSPSNCVQTQPSNSQFNFILNSLKSYWKSPAFLPSFSLSLLYLTVLNFSGQMITYLLNSGYTSLMIALTRTLSVAIELSATWIAPRLMERIGAPRSGMWFLSVQMMCLAAAVSFFWAKNRPLVAASGLVIGTILSRIGLWGFDLCAQFIIQEEIQTDSRGSFSATEAALQNFFELLSYATTISFSRPEQFHFPALISIIAVYTSGCLYGIYLRKRRGHLLHLDTCMKLRHRGAD